MSSSNERQFRQARDEDEAAAQETAALGKAEISRSTGTAGPGSGIGLTEGTRSPGDPTDATTRGATDQSDDLTDAAGPSGARFGGTGTAGSGLGKPSTTATGAADDEREASEVAGEAPS